MNRGGIFLDRDGTINREVDFLSTPDELQLLPGSAEAIRIANELGFKVIVVTNQSGIARGLLTESQLASIHTKLIELLAAEQASLDAIYFCPHHPELGVGAYRRDCDCRKPNTGMVKRAVDEFGIDPKESFVIGDRMLDIQLGRNVSARSILVKTGYGNEELELCRSNDVAIDFVADDLLDAMHFVRRQVRETQLPYSS